MKILAISTNTGDTSAYVDEETDLVNDLARRGVIELVLVKADWSGAVLLLEVDDADAARATVEALPIAAHGLTRFEYTPVLDLSATTA